MNQARQSLESIFADITFRELIKFETDVSTDDKTVAIVLNALVSGKLAKLIV